MKKIFILSLMVILALGLSYKLAKKAYYHVHRVKAAQLYDTRHLVFDLHDGSNQEGLKIFTASSLDRIFTNGQTLEKPSFNTKASLSAARNEFQDFQVVVQAAEDEPQVTLSTSDLTNVATGYKIPKNYFTWRVVGFVRTVQPYYPVKAVGKWPDPLLEGQSTDIPHGHTQPFWLTVYVPPNTPPGDYTAKVTVKGLSFPEQTIPVDLHVFNFTLPTESHLKTAFDFYGQLTKFRYLQGEMESAAAWHARLDDINDKFVIEMLKHRMNPVLNLDPTSQTELSWIDRFQMYGLNNFAIGKHGGTFENNWPYDDNALAALRSTYETYGEDLKLNHLLKYTYVYTWDEGQIGNPQVAKVAAMIHNAYPGLKNMVSFHGFWDPSQNPSWGKDIDIWCFQIDDFNETKMRNLQRIGKEIWMYISGPNSKPSPNLALDFDSIDYRIIPWICWKYDIRGFLYWCVNYWPNVDPFKNARNGEWEQNGNGLIFYPGPNGPLDSIRTENFRDGMQDYEYIYTLLNKLRLMHSQGLEQKYKEDFNRSMKLLTMDDSLVKSMWDFTKDGDYLKSRRDAIGREIEKLNLLGIKN